MECVQKSDLMKDSRLDQMFKIKHTGIFHRCRRPNTMPPFLFFFFPSIFVSPSSRLRRLHAASQIIRDPAVSTLTCMRTLVVPMATKTIATQKLLLICSFHRFLHARVFSWHELHMDVIMGAGWPLQSSAFIQKRASGSIYRTNAR